MKVNHFQLLYRQENSDSDPFALNDEAYPKSEFIGTTSITYSIQPTQPMNIPIIMPPKLISMPPPPTIPLLSSMPQIYTYQNVTPFSKVDGKLFIDAGYVLHNPQRALQEISRALGAALDSSEMKYHFSWGVEKHRKFAIAACAFGVYTVAPRYIMQVLGDSQLRRESVASHLQKFRLALVRKHKLANVAELRNYHLPDNIPGLDQIRAAWERPDFQGFTQEDIVRLLKY